MNNKYDSWYVKVLRVITRWFSSIHWNGLRALFNGGVYYSLREADHAQLRRHLSKSYYIILTQRKSHLTSYLIGLLSLFKTGKWPRYTHALMNVDNVVDPSQWERFKLMEATNSGVHWSTFMEVFDCDSVCLLKPKHYSKLEWNRAVDKLFKSNGLPYDDLFDLADETHLSCVELVRTALRASPEYDQDFKNFEEVIKKVGNLTPEMFRDCEDFDVIFEVQR